MRSISYRSRMRLKKGAKIGLAILAVLLLAVILFAVYLGRFVVYTPDGARLDFGRNTARDVELPPESDATRTPARTPKTCIIVLLS